MDILIKGMEMPKDEYVDVRIFKDGRVIANQADANEPNSHYATFTAIAVPSHGDWHTGTPTEDGDYLVKLDVEHNVYPYYFLRWNKKGWYSHHDMDYPACPQHSVLKWQKIAIQ